ncbi:putative alpha-galactosidase B [Leucoagaricus sp. SymC.cos]|nr:putative alpha-galactosidase B [Leucoagaricus sp. SymC.cos]
MIVLPTLLVAASLVLAQAPTDPPSKQTGRLPALGWNTWNAYRCDINATKVLAAANQFVSLGLKSAGYEYVNIDDCWSVMSRDSSGKIVPDPNKFPNGISGVASQVHALGLKMGIYSDAGTKTCAGYPGSLGNELVDATTFASWGIDYLKYDNCNVPSNWTDASSPPGGDWYNSNSAIRYRQMTSALDKVSHPIQLDICIWGQAQVWTWGAPYQGHSWRMSGDSSPTWSYITNIININVAHLNTIDFFAHNDMDMMEIGNGALTIQEQRTHFAAWAFFKSPILLGTDVQLGKLNSQQIAIITNKELLAFSQDSTIGTPAKPFTAFSGAPTTSPPEYYSGASSKGTHVFIINTGSSTATLSNVPGLGTSGSFKIHDMWNGTDLSGTFSASSTFTVNVAAHDTAAYLITKA